MTYMETSNAWLFLEQITITVTFYSMQDIEPTVLSFILVYCWHAVKKK